MYVGSRILRQQHRLSALPRVVSYHDRTEPSPTRAGSPGNARSRPIAAAATTASGMRAGSRASCSKHLSPSATWPRLCGLVVHDGPAATHGRRCAASREHEAWACMAPFRETSPTALLDVEHRGEEGSYVFWVMIVSQKTNRWPHHVV